VIPRALCLALVLACTTTVSSAARMRSAEMLGATHSEEDSPTALLARAASGEEAAERTLVALGESAADAALADFAKQSTAERRVRAHVVERTGRASAILPALAGLADSDASVRISFARFLARPELLTERSAERVDRLAQLALEDGDSNVREAALRAIGELDDPRAAATLDSSIDTLGGDDRALAAELLASDPDGRTRAAARLVRAARGLENTAIFAALLVPCAHAAADDPNGFKTVAERAPILAGLRHFDPVVRAAAGLALDGHVNRLLAQHEYERASSVLAAFGEDGFDTCRTLEERARVAMLSGAHDEEAIAFARELDAAARAREEPYAASWRARAAHLEALAWIAKNEPLRAEEPLRRAQRFLDERLAGRADLTGKAGSSEHVAVLFERASIAVSEAGRLIVAALLKNGGRDLDTVSRATLEALRTAHRLTLEAQRVAWRADVEAPASFDVVWQANVGLFDLVLDVARRTSFGPERSLAVRRVLGRALATVAPLEAIGFEPYANDDRELGDPHADPRRRALLVGALDAMCDQLASSVSKARRALMRASIEEPGGAEPEDQRALLTAEFRFQDAVERRGKAEEGDASGLAELRTPSSFVVWLARALREEGRAKEGRPILLRARDFLDASEIAQNFLWGIEMKAEIEMMLGSSISDEGDPHLAEIELIKAERRLAELEDTLKERGAGAATLALVRNQRCNALVSLAVNANVKMHDPARAVAWFEQAWEIRKDDFMRVLLACYRAREEKRDEARALVRDVTPGPGTFYNLACTWALLGEHETALAFLKRDLAVNYPTERALAKQKDWARDDPDLESMRGDARFIEIVGKPK